MIHTTLTDQAITDTIGIEFKHITVRKLEQFECIGNDNIQGLVEYDPEADQNSQADEIQMLSETLKHVFDTQDVVLRLEAASH